MNDPASTPLDVALAYHRAWTSGDIDEVMSQAAGNVVCHAPAGTMTGIEALRGIIFDRLPFAIARDEVVPKQS